MNTSEPIQALRQLIGSIDIPTSPKGRPVSAFTINPVAKTYHRATREAYALRFHHFKILMAVELGGGIDAVPNASARRTLWLYMHHCLPDYPGKEAELRALHNLHNANKLMLGIEQMILRKLTAGEITDAGYAATVRDEARFLSFATDWFSRPVGSRAKARKSRA
jgi:hypothetical protein